MNYHHTIILDNLNAEIRRHRDVILGHDAVHPDRNVCGGVGWCVLMRAEHEMAQAVVDHLEHAAREGLIIQTIREETTV